MLGEELAARAALSLSVIGVISIALLGQLFQPQELAIGKINDSIVGKSVLVKGVVEWRREKNGALLFGLSDGKRINCVLFKKDKTLSGKIRPKSFLIVEGRVEKHMEELGIVVERLEEWKR